MRLRWPSSSSRLALAAWAATTAVAAVVAASKTEEPSPTTIRGVLTPLSGVLYDVFRRAAPLVSGAAPCDEGHVNIIDEEFEAEELEDPYPSGPDVDHDDEEYENPPTNDDIDEEEEEIWLSQSVHASTSSSVAAAASFAPLDCNAGLADAPCSDLSTLPDLDTNVLVTIPCGACYTYDLGNATFAKGLRVTGRLLFDSSSRDVVVRARYVVVEGALEVRSDAGSPVTTSGAGGIRFVLTGTRDVRFAGESWGPKPMLVAGGRLDVRAFPSDDDCATHTVVLDDTREDPSLDPDAFDAPTPLKDTCPGKGDGSEEEEHFLRYDFDDGQWGNWTGNWGAYLRVEDGALRVFNRWREDQGPYLDLTPTQPGLCLTADTPYLFSARVKLDRADKTLVGRPTTCANYKTNCLHLGTRIRARDGSDHSKTKARLYNHHVMKYGEWFNWSAVVQWDADELNPSNAYTVLYLHGAEAGVDVSMDTIRIKVPDATSFADPDDLCGELVLNGDAEADDMSPYPIRSASSVPLFVRRDEENNNNHYFHHPNRYDSYTSPESDLNPACLTLGTTYRASIRVHVHTEFPLPYKLYVRYLRAGTDNTWDSRHVLSCPPQKYDDGWKTCQGEFMIDPTVAASERVKWRFFFSSARDEKTDVDYDDVSFAYVRGPVTGLVVDAKDVSCWGAGAEVHATTSVYYSFKDNEVPNGHITTLRSAPITNGDGTATLRLTRSPHVPIVTKKDDADVPADVALLSRKVVIEGDDDDDDDKGAQLVLARTSNVAQVVEGVEFRRAGRLGEADRYPLRLSYLGAAPGTSIRYNSFQRPNLRCVAVEGTSNVTVAHNVAYQPRGHCFYVGMESQHNTIEGNLVSDGRQTSYADRVVGETDYRSAAFRNRYGPNDYVANKAVGNRYYGFDFYNSYETVFEDGSTGQPSPRQLPPGTFTGNEAHSNGDSGMRFDRFQQSELITLSHLKVTKNRYYGIYGYFGAKISIEDSLLAESATNLDLRWWDEVTLQDSDVRGVSHATQKLTHPVYYNRPCVTSGFKPPVGYRMSTNIHYWDGAYPDGTLKRNKGATLINVNFSHFDRTDECANSAPVTFNTVDRRDGHWDYASSFTNVRFGGTKLMEAGEADDGGVMDIVITDSNGSSDPAQQATTPGTFVSDKPYLKTMARGECKSYHDGVAYCSNTCLRTVQLRAGQWGTADLDLRVRRAGNNDNEVREIYVPGIYQHDGDINSTTAEGLYRRFSASLPAGDYSFDFVRNGKPVWPRYAYEEWESVPDCVGHVATDSVTVVSPDLVGGQCDDLIENGDMEIGLVRWQHMGSGAPSNGFLKVLEGGGVDGSDAIGYYNRYRSYHGFNQDLDTRCFHQNLHAYYEIKSWFRLEKEGDPFLCDKFDSGYPNRCPRHALKTVRYEDPATKEVLDWDYDNLETYVATSNAAEDFNLLHGVMKINEKYNTVHRAVIYFDDLHASFDTIVDDVSMTKLETSCTGDFVRNGDFATGDSRFWRSYGSTKYETIETLGDHVLKIYDRTRKDYGVRQDLYIDLDCVKENDRFSVNVRYQIQDNAGNVVECDRNASDGVNECAYVRVKVYSDDHGNPAPYVAKTVPVHADEGMGDWTLMSGIFTLGPAEATHTSMYLFVGGPHIDRNIVIDSVSVDPMSVSCKQVILNPSFSLNKSSSYWSVSHQAADVSISSPGATDGYSVLLQPDSTRQYLQQALDMRCIVAGQDFVLSAKFKLLDASNLNPLECDSDSRRTSDEQHCPTITLRGRNCNEDFHYLFWNEKQVTWDANGFNDFEYDIPITANIASCDSVTVELGYFLPISRALLIDDVNFSQKTTFAPTKSPTFSPTQGKETGPTSSPTKKTDAPTTSSKIPCPPSGDVVILAEGSVIVSISDLGSLCIINKVIPQAGSTGVTIVPLARSYDTNTWEMAAGSISSATFAGKEFLCYEQGCQINLPEVEEGTEYHLTSSTYTASLRDQYARFLETASFGATTAELDDLEAATGNDGSIKVIADFVESQMDTNRVSMTSHREYWRTRSNPRITISSKAGIPDHPCDKMSRWRKFTFVSNDALSWIARTMRVKGNGPYELYLNGHLRTVVDDFWLSKNDTYSFDPNFDYTLCSVSQDVTGSILGIQLEDGVCVNAENPPVDISGQESEVSRIFDLTEAQLVVIDEALTNGEEFILPEGLDDTLCDSIPTVPEIGNEPIYGRLSDGSWLLFDPHLTFLSNTPTSPLGDGGKASEVASGGKTYCSNAAKTFLNEDECVLSSDACTHSGSTDIEVLLEDDMINSLYDLTGRYVYGLKGLNVVDQIDDGSDFPWKLPHPCTPLVRSRWMKKLMTDCNLTDIFSGTQSSLAYLLSDDHDTNPYVRDIYFPESGLYCNDTDTDPNIEISVGDHCWKRVHDDYFSVYDMTYWVSRHPGGPHHITKWVENKDTFLIFPNGQPINNHPMDRWNINYHKFTYIGRYGDNVKIRDLPNNLRTEAVTDFYEDAADIDTGGVLVCGSPGEVSNDKMRGFVFDYDNELDFSTRNTWLKQMKKNLWIMLVLDAPDQLRQRVAWALAQILVVVLDAAGADDDETESFLQYYDIFVRNAFGNYRNILKEISYAPLMAENLSYLYSKSAAYVWERYRIKAQADENFAREIMQLFSMGLVELNLDGSPKLNEHGKIIHTYSNEDIMSLSRAWTGFNLQPRRGNMEGFHNRVDPMRIEATWRDRFPKSDTTRGYIGDYYPLCEDLPDKAFLKKGATYKFLGSSVLPNLMSDPNEFESDESIQRMILEPSSNLRAELCNPNSDGKCQFSNTVVLPGTKVCTGIECQVDTIRVVQVRTDAFYEYVRAPCVNQVFYNGAKKISRYYRGSAVMCGNPKVMEASEACCPFGSTSATRNAVYDGERMLFSTAKNRCKEASKDVCDFYRINGDRHKLSNFFWTSDDCDLRVKINSDGLITIVHHTIDSSNIVQHLSVSNENWFRVYWDKNIYPKAANKCDGICDVIDGNSCLCATSVSRNRGFTSIPNSIDELYEKLFIGHPDPSIFEPGLFSSTVHPETGITMHSKNGAFDSNTVFEFSDDKGRTFFAKNVVEKVLVRGLENVYSGYSFRNTPQFMSFVPSEETIRDAQFETDATLDHYFYHDSTAPFLSLRLIQRLVLSNPSPRYIRSVATAFKEGTYVSGSKSFGTGKYGDMAAMIAAIYLDREARTIALESDPSYGALREPLLKFMSVMRSMDFVSTYPVIGVSNIKHDIGQMVHEFETVFSFFLPEFEPYGRVGDAALVSPEGTLLDMPRIVGMLNGLTSLTRYGLSNCDGGFGGVEHRCNERIYLPSPYGVLEYNKTSYEEEFSYETFEGPSLVGGFDNIWSGRDYEDFTGVTVVDPKDGDGPNHVYHPVYNYRGVFFSQPVVNSESTVVKFQYLGSESQAGGCIGYSSVDVFSETWMYCDGPSRYANNVMTSNNEWISCQYEVPASLNKFRIVLGDRRSSGDAYFDNVQISSGTGTFCHSDDTNVNLENKTPPGQSDRSNVVVDNLATLLTAGRLSAENRQLVREAYDNAGSANDGLRIAQEMILLSSEFHTTNTMKSEGNARSSFSFPPPTGKPYKALVYVMFAGGCDSYNMLVPHTCPKQNNLYDQYLSVREQVAIPRNLLLPIDVDDQVCNRYGLHPDLPAIQRLYNDRDLLFFANTGVMSQPVDKSNYRELTETQLFAHNHMQRETKRVDPYNSKSGTGVIGRMADILESRGHNVGSFSIDRYSVALAGVPGVSEAPMIVNNNGVPPAYLGDRLKGIIGSIHKTTLPDSGFFGETWSEELMKSLETNDLLSLELEGVTPSTEFPDTYLSRQLETVSRLIATREARGVDTDLFYVEIGGFDTHASVEENLSTRFKEVNEGFDAFATEMKSIGLWNSVTLIQTSDFGRTLNPNSGDGTDHAWGGNYMMMGGSVSGKKIAGHYLHDFSEDGPLYLSRGRIIPTTPWDAVFEPIASWIGIPNSDLNEVCPNLSKFNSTHFFNPHDIFEGLDPSSPTTSPSNRPSSSDNKIDNVSSEPSGSLTSQPSQVTLSPSGSSTSLPSQIIQPSEISPQPSQHPSTISTPSTESSYSPSNNPTMNHLPSESSSTPTDSDTNQPSRTMSRSPSGSHSFAESNTPSVTSTVSDVPVVVSITSGSLKLDGTSCADFSTPAEVANAEKSISSSLKASSGADSSSADIGCANNKRNIVMKGLNVAFELVQNIPCGRDCDAVLASAQAESNAMTDRLTTSIANGDFAASIAEAALTYGLELEVTADDSSLSVNPVETEVFVPPGPEEECKGFIESFVSLIFGKS